MSAHVTSGVRGRRRAAILFAARDTNALWWLPIGDDGVTAGEPRPTALPVSGPSLASIAVSPDGRRVAWTAGASSSSIWATAGGAGAGARAGATATPLVPSTDIGWRAAHPAVAADGRIAFMGNRGNAGNKIFLVEPGRPPRQLTTDARDHFSPFWLRGEKALAVLANHGDGIGWWLSTRDRPSSSCSRWRPRGRRRADAGRGPARHGDHSDLVAWWSPARHGRTCGDHAGLHGDHRRPAHVRDHRHSAASPTVAGVVGRGNTHVHADATPGAGAAALSTPAQLHGEGPATTPRSPPRMRRTPQRRAPAVTADLVRRAAAGARDAANRRALDVGDDRAARSADPGRHRARSPGAPSPANTPRAWAAAGRPGPGR